MAAKTRIVSLNLGMQTLGLAEFRTGADGGLVLESFRTTELLADPAADASRIGQMKVAVKEMVDGLHLRGAKVNYALPAQSVFTRFVKLPAVGEEKVDQIVTFEAQQNVPFPIDEVVWDYQLVGDSEEKMEVVLVAIKSDLLEDLNEAIEGSGLQTSVVDVAPMALYNAFRYNYSDVGNCSLMIDIGARTTNLLFIDGKRVFSRSIPIGGNTVSAAIAKEFVEPFGAAEERKRAVGYVSLGGAYAEHHDPEIARVSKIVRNTMTRLHSEIARSISFYRAQQHGNQPARAYLCGGGASLPYAREFFNEKLQMPIELFNPLRNVTAGSKLNAEEIGTHAHALGELVGLSLRSINNCPMELNLLPQGVQRAQELAQRRRYLLLAATCVTLALILGCLYFWWAAAVKNDELEKINPKVAALKELESKFTAIKTEVKETQDSVSPLLQTVNERQYWVRIIDDLNARLPQHNIWITILDPGMFSSKEPNSTENKEQFVPSLTAQDASSNPVSGGGKGKAQPGLRIRGLYMSNAAVLDQFVKNLAESPNFSDVTSPLHSSPNATDWAWEYEINLHLKKPMSFQ